MVSNNHYSYITMLSKIIYRFNVMLIKNTTDILHRPRKIKFQNSREDIHVRYQSALKRMKLWGPSQWLSWKSVCHTSMNLSPRVLRRQRQEHDQPISIAHSASPRFSERPMPQNKIKEVGSDEDTCCCPYLIFTCTHVHVHLNTHVYINTQT